LIRVDSIEVHPKEETNSTSVTCTARTSKVLASVVGQETETVFQDASHSASVIESSRAIQSKVLFSAGVS
jgi:hypothetical protein